jgi:hypothetical protein
VLARYRGTMALVVEDGAVQRGAAMFRGTHILVHQIAALLEQGAGKEQRDHGAMRDVPLNSYGTRLTSSNTLWP